jgi:LEA14-like dessication related protein
MSRFALRALTLATLLMLSACAAMGPKLEAPTFDIRNVQMLSGDMFAQLFKLHVKVGNPNDIEVPVESIEYTVFMMGDRFGEGTTESAFVLPAHGEAEFDLLLKTDFVSAMGRLVSRMSGGKLENVEYEVTGKVHLAKGLMRTIPFNHKGLVNFSKGWKQRAPEADTPSP